MVSTSTLDRRIHAGEENSGKSAAGPSRGQGPKHTSWRIHTRGNSSHPRRQARCSLDETGDRHRLIGREPSRSPFTASGQRQGIRENPQERSAGLCPGSRSIASKGGDAETGTRFGSGAQARRAKRSQSPGALRTVTQRRRRAERGRTFGGGDEGREDQRGRTTLGGRTEGLAHPRVARALGGRCGGRLPKRGRRWRWCARNGPRNSAEPPGAPKLAAGQRRLFAVSA